MGPSKLLAQLPARTLASRLAKKTVLALPACLVVLACSRFTDLSTTAAQPYWMVDGLGDPCGHQGRERCCRDDCVFHDLPVGPAAVECRENFRTTMRGAICVSANCRCISCRPEGWSRQSKDTCLLTKTTSVATAYVPTACSLTNVDL